LAKVIAANVSEAARILDGLLHHECSLEIREHYTDTAGAIDHVFGLCHLLGFRFAPRIRDLADRRLYVADGHAVYTALNPMIGGTLDFRGISENWNETLRGAASIKAGTVAPSACPMLLHADLFSRWSPKVERVDHPKPPFLRQREASYFAAGDSVVGFRP
jgi:TnpA family transposase